MVEEIFTYDIGDHVWSKHFDTVFVIDGHESTHHLNHDDKSKYEVTDIVRSAPEQSGDIEKRKLDPYFNDSEKFSPHYDMERSSNEVYYVSQEHDAPTCVADVKGWNEQTERYDINVLVDTRRESSGEWTKETYGHAHEVWAPWNSPLGNDK